MTPVGRAVGLILGEPHDHDNLIRIAIAVVPTGGIAVPVPIPVPIETTKILGFSLLIIGVKVEAGERDLERFTMVREGVDG